MSAVGWRVRVPRSSAIRGGSQLAQLFINQREQFVGGLAVPLPDRVEDFGHIAHSQTVGWGT